MLNLDPQKIASTVGPMMIPQGNSPMLIPGRGPVSMPVAMPGPGGQGGGYNRYREMTLEEIKAVTR